MKNHADGKLKELTDNGTTQSDIPTEVDISCHSQMIQVDDMRYLFESFVELLDLKGLIQEGILN